MPGPFFNRRTFLAGSAALACLPWQAHALNGLPPLGTPVVPRLFYDLSWLGVPVGEHEIIVTSDGGSGDFTVVNRVVIEISLLFFDVIRFEHHSTETWRAGLLSRFESTTEDDGEFYTVTGKASEEGFALSSNTGDFLAPADALTSNDVWTPPVPGRRPFINPKKGEVVDVTVSRPTMATVRRNGLPVTTERFDISSSIAEGALFYDGGLFVSGWFTRRGRTVDYRLA